MNTWIAAGNSALSDYLGYGIATDPAQLQGMTAEQKAEYERRQGDPRNVAMNAQSLRVMQYANAYRPPAPKPTMTLAQWDERRAAFRALEGKK